MAKKKLLTLKEAADVYSVSEASLRRLNSSGDLKFRKAGARLVRLAVTDLDALFGLEAAA